MQEKGFTKIDNEVLENICSRETKLNATQITIILLIIRYTSGFSRESHALSAGFLAKASGIHKKQIMPEINKLIQFHIIEVAKEASFNSPRELRINMNTSEWSINKYSQSVNSLTGSKFTPTPGSKFTPQERNNIKKYIKKCSCASFESFWSEYPRKISKQAALKAWNKLNPDEALLNRILSALKIQAKSEQWIKDNGQYIPYPATWLNGMRWQDEPEWDEPEPIYENNKAAERILTLDDFESR